MSGTSEATETRVYGRTGKGTSYEGRAFERRLVQSGRRIVSLDIDETLLERIDSMLLQADGTRRRGLRRGHLIDQLIRSALGGDALVT